MRFYKNKKTGSFICVHLESKKVSTSSSYPETFYEYLKNGTYKFFDFSERGVSKANEKKICFSDSFDDLGAKFEGRTYHYVGNASNTQDLIALLELKNPIKKKSLYHEISEQIDYYNKQLKKTKTEYDQTYLEGLIEGLELALSMSEENK